MARIADPPVFTTLEEIRQTKPKTVFYSSKTCWWTTNPDDLCCAHGIPANDCVHGDVGGVPLDPAGAPLLLTYDVVGFLKDAEQNADRYGRHGIKAFVLAHHGNVIERGLPRCSTKWDSYNDLLDTEPSAEVQSGGTDGC